MQADFTTTAQCVTEWSSNDRERTVFQSHAYSLQHPDSLIQQCPFAFPRSIQYNRQICSRGEMFAPISDYQGVKLSSTLFACEHEHFADFVGQGICLGMKLYQSDAITDIDNAGSSIFPESFSMKL